MTSADEEAFRALHYTGKRALCGISASDRIDADNRSSIFRTVIFEEKGR
jgi:hypothetical protein